MKLFLPVIFVLLIISGCTSATDQNESLIIHTATTQPSPSITILPSETSTPVPSQTPAPTKTSAFIEPTVSVATLNAEATLEAAINLCDEFETGSDRYAILSPNGDNAYTIFEYDLSANEMMFSGTATPYR